MKKRKEKKLMKYKEGLRETATKLKLKPSYL